MSKRLVWWYLKTVLFSIPAGASSRPPSSPGVTVVNASTQSDLSLLTGTESSIGNLIASLERKTNHSLLNNVKNMVNFQMFTSNLSTGYYSSCWYSSARKLGIWRSCWLIPWFRVMIGNSPLLYSDKLMALQAITSLTTLQSVKKAKLSKHRFWHCHENGLNKTRA